MPTPADGRGGLVKVLTVGAAVVAVLAGLFAFRGSLLGLLPSPSEVYGEDWGEVSSVVPSPDGTHQAVVYEFRAMIDTGWIVALERPDESSREWVWRSVEFPSPVTVRFAEPSRVEIVDENGVVYSTSYDESTLAPDERFCLRPEYCHSPPWTSYTKSGALTPL